MTLDEYKTDNKANYQYDDICGYCGVECNGSFCSKTCKNADRKENTSD